MVDEHFINIHMQATLIVSETYGLIRVGKT